MDKFYETETDRIRQHIRTELSMGQRLRNWWNYHWHLVAIGAAALALVVYLGSDFAVAKPEDYSVAWVGREYLSDETAEAFETALAAFGEDRNGDGKVLVRLHQIPLDLGEIARQGSTFGQQEHANILALNADLNSCQSVLFLLEDPQAFQAFSGALLYLDGSEPQPEATDWENMVLEWTQIFDFLPEGIEGSLYLGCRGCWKEEQWEDWNASRQLRENLYGQRIHRRTK